MMPISRSRFIFGRRESSLFDASLVELVVQAFVGFWRKMNGVLGSDQSALDIDDIAFVVIDMAVADIKMLTVQQFFDHVRHGATSIRRILN